MTETYYFIKSLLLAVMCTLAIVPLVDATEKPEQCPLWYCVDGQCYSEQSIAEGVAKAFNKKVTQHRQCVTRCYKSYDDEACVKMRIIEKV